MRVTANGKPVDLVTGATVDDLLRALDLSARWVIVERNGEPVARSELAITSLADGDRIEIVRAVAGG